MTRTLTGKRIVIIGAGHIGSAVAKEFHAEGAIIGLASRRHEPLLELAREIAWEAGILPPHQPVEITQAESVSALADSMQNELGRVDVVVNATGMRPVQGVPLTEIGKDDFMAPIQMMLAGQFNLGKAFGRIMKDQRCGTILSFSASPATLAIGATGGFAVACAAMEAYNRVLAAELGPYNIRTVCIRPHRIAETLKGESDLPMPLDEFTSFLTELTLLGKLPTLREVARSAVFAVSDQAGCLTGTTLNLTAGMAVD